MPSTDIPSDASTHATGGALTTVTAHGSLAPTLPWPYALPARPEILTSKPSPGQLLHSLRRRWMLAIGLGTLIASVVAGAVWFLVPVRYEASAYLQVFQNPNTLGAETGLGGAPQGDYANYKRTQQALMVSPKVLLAALRNPEISRLSTVLRHSDDPSGWLAEQLIVEYPGDSEIMRVSLKGDRPDDIKQLVNAVTAAFIIEIVFAERLDRQAQMDVLKSTYENYRSEIQENLVWIDKKSKELGTDSSEGAQLKKKLALQEVQTLLDRIVGMQQDINDLELDMFRLNLQGSQASQMDLPASFVEDQMAKDPRISGLINRIANIEGAVAEEERRVKEPQKAKSVLRLRAMLVSAQDQLESRKAELTGQLAERFKSAGDISAKMKMLELEKAELTTRLGDMKSELATKQKDVSKFDNFSGDLLEKQLEVKSLQDLAGRLDTTLKMRQLEMQTPPRVIQREKAQTPSNSDALRKYFTVAFSGTVGFGLVLFGVAFIEFQARRLNSRREIQEGLGLRVLGDLPSFAGRAWRRAHGRAALQAALAESIDGIRTALIHSRGPSPVRVVMVTSAEPHEGKTTVASQLAGSLARAGKRTLIIDGDLRNPAAHRVFELPQEPGLCDLLRGQVPRESAIQPTPAANLWLIPAGRCTIQTLQALSNGILDETMGSLRKEFDFIVVDSGPVLTVADPLLLGQHVDAAIISVLRDVSQMPKVYETTERLRSVGVAVMGVVVNGGADSPQRKGYEIELAESA